MHKKHDVCIALYFAWIFLDRKKEIERILHKLSGKESALLVLYGRRRIGKTRLLQQIKNDNDIYFTADQSGPPIQIEAFARIAARQIPGFDTAVYPDWASCLETLNARLKERLNEKITQCDSKTV